MYETAQAYWIFRDEFNNLSYFDSFRGMFSGAVPIHSGFGSLSLNNSEISLESEEILFTLPLQAITEIYLGFDDLYTSNYVKNFGLFWSPLRITFIDEKIDNSLYIVTDFDHFTTQNEKWYKLLTGIL